MPGTLEGVSSIFHHVDLAIASPHLMPGGPFSGDYITTVDESGGAIGFTSGLVFVTTTIPPAWGRKIGYNGIVLGQDQSEDDYNPFWGALTAWTVLPLAGTVIPTQRVRLSHGIEVILWDDALPQAITVHAEPGWEFDLYTLHL